MDSRLRSIIVLMTLVCLVAPLSAGVAGADHAIDLYRSDQFGYYFFYESGTWAVADATSEPGSDFVRLIHDTTVADYWAFAAPGLAEEDCIAAVLGSNPAIVEVQALTQGGDPVRLDRVGTGPAWIMLTTESSAGPIQYSTLQECHELIPGGAFLYSSISVPADPRQGFSQPWIRGFYATMSGRVHDPVVTIDSADGTSGSLTIDECVQTDGLYVAAQGAAGDADFVIDPRSFVAASRAGGVDAITPTWLFPATATIAPLSLGPGEVGLFKLDIANGISIYFFPAGGPPVRIGAAGACGGGGVAAPVIIDME